MSYTHKDTVCPHCDGEITGHGCGDKVIYWCDSCGSNNRESPPYIGIDMHKGRKKGD